MTWSEGTAKAKWWVVELGSPPLARFASGFLPWLLSVGRSDDGAAKRRKHKVAVSWTGTMVMEARP